MCYGCVFFKNEFIASIKKMRDDPEIHKKFILEVSRRFRRNIHRDVLVRIRSDHLFYFFFLFFNVLLKKFWVVCLLSNALLYLTSLSYIDFVPYVYFKTKHNLYLNEHSLNAWLIVLHISWISC